MNETPPDFNRENVGMDRMTAAPLIYDTVMFRLTAAAPVGNFQTFTLDVRDYGVFDKGNGEAAPETGLETLERDFFFTNLFKGGSFDKRDGFWIDGLGVQFIGQPFILGAAPFTVVDPLAGALLSSSVYAETLANLILMQTFIRAGAKDEDDCGTVVGQTAAWGYGPVGLGDNAATPRLLNAVVGNERMLRYALFEKPVSEEGRNNITFDIKRSRKTAFSAALPLTGVAGASAIGYLATVFAWGRRTPVNANG